MTPIDTTAAAQTDSISFEFDLNHSPERVWRALTEPALLKEWFLPVVGFAAEVGNEFTCETKATLGWAATVECRVLAVEPSRMIRYSWVVKDASLDTVVTFTLSPTPGGTHVRLVQSGFRREQGRNFGGARLGWKRMGEKLVAVLGSAS